MKSIIIKCMNPGSHTGNIDLPVYFYKNTTLKHFEPNDILISNRISISKGLCFVILEDWLYDSTVDYLNRNISDLVLIVEDGYCNIIFKNDYEVLLQNEAYSLDSMEIVEIKCPICNSKIKLNPTQNVQECCNKKYTLERVYGELFAGYKILRK